MLVIIITVVKVINRDGASDKVMETVHYKGFNHP